MVEAELAGMRVNTTKPQHPQIGSQAFRWPTLATLCLLLCGLLQPALAAVYKTTDAEGNVEFTDVPPNPTEGAAQALELPAGNVYQPSAAPLPAAANANEEELPEQVRYERLSITSPANDAAIRENAGNVTVFTRVKPDLQEGHKVQVLLDGQPWPITSQGAIAMTNVDRGTHTLTAQVLGEDNQVLISSDPVTFHMQRISVLTRPRQPSINP